MEEREGDDGGKDKEAEMMVTMVVVVYVCVCVCVVGRIGGGVSYESGVCTHAV